MNGKRTQKFLIALDDYIGNYSYYDEEKDETIIDGGENDCYDYLMIIDEFHLLGEKIVREYIHIAFTDYERFFNLLKAYKAFAG